MKEVLSFFLLISNSLALLLDKRNFLREVHIQTDVELIFSKDWLTRLFLCMMLGEAIFERSPGCKLT